MSQLLRVQNFMLSADGFGAGEGQRLEEPFGTPRSRPFADDDVPAGRTSPAPLYTTGFAAVRAAADLLPRWAAPNSSTASNPSRPSFARGARCPITFSRYKDGFS